MTTTIRTRNTTTTEQRPTCPGQPTDDRDFPPASRTGRYNAATLRKLCVYLATQHLDQMAYLTSHGDAQAIWLFKSYKTQQMHYNPNKESTS